MPEVRVSIRARGVRLPDALRSYAERRVRFATHRFASRLGDIQVHLSDANGPRGGGADKVCLIAADLPREKRIVIEERQAGLLIAIYRATRRLAFAVSREVNRQKAMA
jgi:putative sigma-54 modulation protein